MSRRLAALLAVAALAAAACGDSSPEVDVSDQREETAAGAQEPENEAGGLEVKALDFSFEPSELEVAPGDDVTIDFVNGGSVAHSFTTDQLRVDVTAEAGGTALVGFQAPDEDTTIEFVCRFHPDQMQGTITVGEGGSGAGSGGGSDDYDY